MAPSRPAVYPDQWGLVAVIAIIFAVGIYVFVRALVG
jgi:hypothetical protein